MIPRDESRGPAALLSGRELVDFLTKACGQESFRICLLDDNTRSLSPLGPAGVEGVPLATGSIPLDSPLARVLAEPHADCFPPLEPAAPSTPADTAAQAAAQLKALGATHAFALRAGPKLAGALVLRDARGSQAGPMLAPDAVRLFVRCLNSLLRQAREAESREMVGHISRGLAHDLRGWLTPVAACLQLWGAGGADSQKAARLRPTAVKNLEAMQACLEQARYISRNRKPRFRLIRPAAVLRKSALLTGPLFEAKNARIVVEAPESLEAEADDVLLLRLLNNLLTNAARATPPSTEVRVELSLLTPAPPEGEWVQLRVINPGAPAVGEGGAATPSLDELPDGRLGEDSGWGVGLQVCREILSLHHGTLSMSVAPEPATTRVEARWPRQQPR